jgi:hypothetical protein
MTFVRKICVFNVDEIDTRWKMSALHLQGSVSIDSSIFQNLQNIVSKLQDQRVRKSRESMLKFEKVRFSKVEIKLI